FDGYRRGKTDKQVQELHVVAETRDARDADEGAKTGETFAQATWFARDLVNAPANDVHPTHLAEVAAEVARAPRLKLRVFDRDDCEKMGMGAFLGVAAGSEQPPKFIHLTYTPAARAVKRVVIIGK